MNTQHVADRLVSLCREGKNIDALQELYSPNVVSTEMPWVPNLEVVTKGIKDVTKKNVDWFANVEAFHERSVSDPILAGNHFATKMVFDATFKDRGRNKFEEVCVYEVNEGKIVNEQFFYSM